MSLPTAATPGYGTMHGLVGCDDVIAFLELAEQLGLAMGLIQRELDLVQLVGDAADSAGVHLEGSAFDVKQRSPAWIKLYRMMGAAVWPREDASWAGNEHAHGVIPCRHNRLTAYQWTAYVRGYNGLGQGPAGTRYAGQWGYGARDDQWRPATIPTLAQGRAWATAEIERLTMPTPQEIAAATWRADIITAPPNTDPKNPTWAPGSYLRETFRRADAAANAAAQARNEAAATRALVVELIAKGSGLSLDDVAAAARRGAQEAIDSTIDQATTTVQLVVDPATPPA
jgi:hypothetical protein